MTEESIQPNVQELKGLLENRIIHLRREITVELSKPDYSKAKADDLISQVLALQCEYRARYVGDGK